MTRQLAWDILNKYLKNPILIKHSLATEATMMALAKYFGEDENVWGLTGLLHDADYDLCKSHPEKHGVLFFEKEPNTIPSNVERAIKSHNYIYTRISPLTRMEWSMICCDELTGLIIAASEMHPDKKLKSLTLEYIMNRMKEKNFAKGADRMHIYQCQEKLGIPLIEFITITLTAMQEISKEIETE